MQTDARPLPRSKHYGRAGLTPELAPVRAELQECAAYQRCTRSEPCRSGSPVDDYGRGSEGMEWLWIVRWIREKDGAFYVGPAPTVSWRCCVGATTAPGRPLRG